MRLFPRYLYKQLAAHILRLGAVESNMEVEKNSEVNTFVGMHTEVVVG
jgi:hypothetical protein